MSLKLTEEMIIRKAKGNYSLPYIRNLKFFNSFLKDISIVSKCTSIESATFSTNNISSLKCFKNLQNLKELSLASNNISDINELIYLGSCPNLTKLWLKNNPISKLWDYRIQVIRYIPSLKFLDDEEITQDEKILANTGSFFDVGYNNKRKMRPPSYDHHINGQRYRNNQYELYDLNNGFKRDYESDEINYNNYDRYQKKKSDTPSKIFDRYGNSKRGISPFNNNNYYIEDEKYNYRNIPGSAQSHNRRFNYDNNSLEVSNNNVQQQKVVNFITDEIRGLNNYELMYLVDFINKKIEKIKYK